MIVGTAGHVDHGKTSLVKALTGIDTDRLPEEKRRGITLELGFAHLDLPTGRRVGVVDVPGHERFVKAMAAGAGGVDVVIFVVAADEGVMPQTREHLDICRLLGVRGGVIAVTKADLLPGLGDGWLELLEGELESLVAGTFLEGAPVVPVSSRTGEGLEPLRAEVARACQRVEGEVLDGRSPDGPLFIPVDRAFTSRGFGLVVTGTVVSGRVAVDAEVNLVPSRGGPFRVRSLQEHGTPVKESRAGARVALNLPELDTSTVERGMVVVKPGQLAATRALDVELSLLPAVPAPLGRRSRALITLGTAQVEGVVALLDVDALRPGETCFAQLRFATPVAALPAQRFILRGTRALEGRGATIGGGRVLALDAPRRRRGGGARLATFSLAPLPERLTWLLTEAGYAGLTEPELFTRAATAPKELKVALDGLASARRVVLVDRDQRRFLDGRVVAALMERAVAFLDTFHAQHRERDGVSREELRQRLSVPHERTYQRVLAALVEAGRVELKAELVALPGRGKSYDEAAAALKAQVAASLQSTGLTPPTPAELASHLDVPAARVVELLRALEKDGAAVRAGELFFAAGPVRALEEKVVQYLSTHEKLSTAAYKELAQVSRKFLIPLAEHLDQKKVTLRVGEDRVLRKVKPAAP